MESSPAIATDWCTESELSISTSPLILPAPEALMVPDISSIADSSAAPRPMATADPTLTTDAVTWPVADISDAEHAFRSVSDSPLASPAILSEEPILQSDPTESDCPATVSSRTLTEL